MDTERGCLEILFRKIPYQTISINDSFNANNTYENVKESLFTSYASPTFTHRSLDEIHQLYNFLKEHFNNNGTVFTLLSKTAEKMLVFDGKEPMCDYEHVLRWRDISFQLGQDIFTTAYLAGIDIRFAQTTEYFAWRPIIRTNNAVLQQILSEGMAENHFHLNGSTQIFHLNWICLMNHIEGRTRDFKEISSYLDHKLQYNFQDASSENGELSDTLYQSVIKAAFYRLYLYLVLKEGIENRKKIQKFMCDCKDENQVEERFFEILTQADESDVPRLQKMIQLTRYEYGFKEQNVTLDYAMDTELMVRNNNEQRILAGERKFMYQCFRFSLLGKFNNLEQNIFYRYLNIRTLFRSELIQVNNAVGFANFSNYERRKEVFIEHYPPYQRELNRLALKSTLENASRLTIEARFAPKRSKKELSKKIKKIDFDVTHNPRTELEIIDGQPKQDEELKNRYFYVLHFIKAADKDKTKDFIPRHNKLREKVRMETRATVSFLEQDLERRERLVGIDAANSEIGCRPEVFASSYRYLRGGLPRRKIGINQERVQAIKLFGTYHAGEDFLDIADGLRAIDEAVLFLNLDRGTRIGHALAMGISPSDYYEFKKNTIRMPAQDLLDNTVWLLEKSKEYGLQLDNKLAGELQRQFEDLYAEIYGNRIPKHLSSYEYYCSWMLRGDDPNIYLLNEEDFTAFIKQEETILQSDYFRINRWVPNERRYNEDYRRLYFYYHFDKSVREKGKRLKEYNVSCSYVKMIFEIQEKMREDISKRGIAIECNPSSNYLIGTIEKYEHHPIFRFNSIGLKEGWNYPLSVSVNTDDQGVFDTYLENEYALLALALEKKKNPDGTNRYNSQEIYQWIDYVRKLGIQQSFQCKVKEKK